MRILLFAISIFVSSVTWAQIPRTSLRGYLLNTESRFERAASQDTVDRKPFNFGIGYHTPKYSVLAEFTQFIDKTGNATSSFERTHQDLLFWARYHAWNLRNADHSFQTNIYVGVGAGTYEEKVVSRLSGVSRTDKANAKFLSALSAGAESSYALNRNFAFVFAIEGRALVASEFDPNPLWGGVLRLGIALPL